MKIEIKILDINIICILRDNLTADKIISILPLKSNINVWGEEIYFPIENINAGLESDAKDVMELGEIAFWIQGNSIAIGFGATPVSVGNEIRLINDANVWADAEDPEQLLKLKNISQNTRIEISFLN
ncbi:MAG: hypothetical protein CL723_04640 [Chloroflexi bacterium]|jgi:hypothetical protein|nr:hypothetical protein [Chloroflexota bacterium]|tara:strand:+ start:5700 stop:6080 length:381 start_codon:yes stop_codon:yes gene_type:complete